MTHPPRTPERTCLQARASWKMVCQKIVAVFSVFSAMHVMLKISHPLNALYLLYICLYSEPAVNGSKNNSLEKKIQGNVWKVQNTTGRFLAQLHPSKFFPKILFLVPKVSDSWIFQKQCFMKIIWRRISIQTLLFQACLPTRQNGVENRDKVYTARHYRSEIS